MNTVVAIRDLNKTFHDGTSMHAVLTRLNMQIAQGERVAIIGPSGSGKSTLLSIIGALDDDFTGSVQVFGNELKKMNAKQLAALRNRYMGFVFQSYNLLSSLTVLQNTLLTSYFSEENANPKRALDVLQRVGLQGKEQRMPAQLSGGERQRVAIARALYHRPPLVLCDEPTGNLDGQTALQIIALLKEVNAEGSAIVIATHDHKVAEIADRILTLHNGTLQEERMQTQGELA